MGVKSAKELNGATICVQPGTSTELAIADYLPAEQHQVHAGADPGPGRDPEHVPFGPLRFAYSTDLSGLASFRFQQGPKATDFTLLPDVISKEPLGLMVRKGDDKFFDVPCARRCTRCIRPRRAAMKHGERRRDVEVHEPGHPAADGGRGRHGQGAGGGQQVGGRTSSRPWATMARCGTGTITPLGIPRGINNLWNKGGLHYPPPIRLTIAYSYGPPWSRGGPFFHVARQWSAA